MARKTTRSATAIAEEQAAADQALLDALTERDANRPTTAPATTTPRTTLADLYGDIVDMVVNTKRSSRLSETTLVRLWELTLMWDLNNRNQQPAIPTWGGGEGTGTELPEIHERITADSSPTEE